MQAPVISDRAKQAAKEVVEFAGLALGNLTHKIHRGRLSRLSGAALPDREIALIKGTRYFALGGTVGTTGYIGEVLPLLIQERVQALDRLEGSGASSKIEILTHEIDSPTAGCIGAFHLAVLPSKRSEISRLSRESCSRSRYPLILLIDIGGTKIEVMLAQLDATGQLTFDVVRRGRMDTPKNMSPRNFYDAVAAFVAPIVESVREEIYEILPLAAVGQPGRFEDSKAAIGENTARDLGPTFPGCQPADLFGRALNSTTTMAFDIHVCNDGRAQFVGIVETLRKNDPKLWEKLLGEKLVYLGIGTGLGFGYGVIDRDGVFTLHDLHSAFDVAATEAWEELPASLFCGMNRIVRLPFEYPDVVCGKFLTKYMHAMELASHEPLFTPLTNLAHGSPETIEKALRNLGPTNSPLGGALINRILESETLDSKTELRLRLKGDELSATLRGTLRNFSHALGNTMVRNLDEPVNRQQSKEVVKEIEKATRRGKRVQMIGIGKSHLIGENLAQIFTNLEIPADAFELTGANCENLAGLQEDDVVFLISKSGESSELLRLFPNLKDKHCVTVAITGNVESSLGKRCQYRINSHVEDEAHDNKEAPTTSTTAALAAGAAMAIVASLHFDHPSDKFKIDRPGLDAHRFSGASKNIDFDPIAKIRSAYRAFANSITYLQDDPQFGPDLLALARRILVSHKQGRTVFFTGAGGCYSVAKKIAATLTSIGIKAQASNCAHLPHGDLGHIGTGDLLVILSFRGETETLLELTDRAAAKNVELALISGRRESSLAGKVGLRVIAESLFEDHLFVGLPDQTIFASFLNLAVGDALAVLLSYMEPMSDDQFASDSHPGGVFARREGRVPEPILADLSRARINQLLNQKDDPFAGVLIRVEEATLRYYLERRNFGESGSPEVMVIGMGGIGLAYLAPLLRAAGKAVCFVDKDRARVRSMEKASYRYQIRKVGRRADPFGPQESPVSRISAMHLGDTESEDQIAALTLLVDVVFTAVGTNNLKDLAPVIVKMANYRYAFHIDDPLNIVLCENLPVGGAILDQVRSCISALLRKEPRELRHYFEKCVGLVPAMDEAIVPQVDAHFTNAVPVEADRAPLYIDGTAWKFGTVEEFPQWSGIQFVRPFRPLHMRKLWVHNMAHSVVGYLGHYVGHSEMCNAIQDPEILDLVRQSAHTVASTLYEEWDYTGTLHPEVDQYVSWLVDRYNNPELGDQVLRVCRDPMRKLDQFDRLIGAINYVLNNVRSVDDTHVIPNLRGALMGVVAAMRYAVDTGAANETYGDLKERILGRLSLDSRYLDEAEKTFDDFRSRPSLLGRRDLSESGTVV